ncbi:hypothetical protein PFUGPA_01205 [Plasmodium falciparum Palo Alto/Uganda]|uniref:Uncharacterized protein n=1 Tax=Plasmodium falciparum (isolate Palo Alto / Uganda) TaxID=57270 RepID=W4J3C9_PLAFP|nr:hypothetical protein PFUGPA_01205 [Plasmodium falciparum Palo Alto/Uganda]
MLLCALCYYLYAWRCMFLLTWSFLLSYDFIEVTYFCFENGPTYPKYYYFPIVKIYPFLKFFIGGGIALSANFSSKFWSIFSTNSHDYFNQKLILLHLGAKDSYNYNFLVIPILAFIFDQNTSLLFAHKITYNTFEHVITKLCFHILSYNSLLTCMLNISWSKKYFFYRGKLNWKFGILTHFLQRHQNMVHTSLLFHDIVHDLLYIQNGSTYFPLRLYFVCTSIFLHSPFCTHIFHIKI